MTTLSINSTLPTADNNAEKSVESMASSVDATKPVAAATPAANTDYTAASANKALTSQKPSAFNKSMRQFFAWMIPPLMGLGLLIAVWTLISHQSQGLPGPVSTFKAAVILFSDPFYINNPNDMGIGWNILNSLQRVATGFGMAALVGIPLGFIIGRYEFMSRMTAPIISLLRPVSPLAWLPIGLLVFKAADPAAIWVIFISAIWPMIINTAVGVSKVPQDYMNVAKVLNLSEWKVVTKILFPYVLPYMMTGVRLSIGVAWLVIVAAEMLTGGVGIGFWVWDEWNNLNVEHIIIAIVIVGVVGLLLEQFLIQIAKRFSYE
ncbi:MAG TPA: nitrate ABC transporter permease [Methylophilus sp.]